MAIWRKSSAQEDHHDEPEMEDTHEDETADLTVANEHEESPTEPAGAPSWKSNGSSMRNEDVERINAVKELLFGENMREYSKEFNELKGLLREYRDESNERAIDFRNELMDRIERIEADLSTKIDNLEFRLTQRIQQLEQELQRETDRLKDGKADRKQLGTMLEDVARKLQF